MNKILKSLYLWLDTEAAMPTTDGAAKIDWLRCFPFVLTHLACFGVFFTGVSKSALIVCAVGYFVRVFAITAFYHRFLSHCAFKTSRFMQFCFALLGASAAQRGPLWWSAHHRHHHKHSDDKADKHSPYNEGFWHSHVIWFLLEDNFKTEKMYINDLLKYPELVFINRFDFLVPIAYAVILYLCGGLQMLLWGYFVSTVLVYHVTFSINSLSHLFGKRRFNTKDHSRNNWWLALLTMGEGWHNNHHYWPSSARQGFKIYEIDLSYYLLKLLEKCGLIWDLRSPPAEVLNTN